MSSHSSSSSEMCHRIPPCVVCIVVVVIFLAAPVAAARISCSFFLIKQMELRYNCISNNISDRQSHDLVHTHISLLHTHTYIHVCNHVIVICLASYCYCNKKKAKKYATLSRLIKLNGNAMEMEQATIIHKDYNTDLCPRAQSKARL